MYERVVLNNDKHGDARVCVRVCVCERERERGVLFACVREPGPADTCFIT